MRSAAVASLALTLALTVSGSWDVAAGGVVGGVEIGATLRADAGDTITGYDGVVYPLAPGILQGRQGELFYGPSFDQFCVDGPEGFETQVARIARLARVIRRSGRRVVFTIAPDKAHVQAENLVRSSVPHGRCGKVGARAHRRVLDSQRDPSFLSVRAALADDKRRVFWRSDPHWTTVGASVFATALANALDPRLGARLTYVRGRDDTRLWPMAAALGLPAETVPTRRPGGRVEITETRGHLDVTGHETLIDHSWRTAPKDATWPGRTVILGDSFTFLGLGTIRPVFRQGRFLWMGPAQPQDTINRAVRRADTVVIEVAEFLVPTSPLTQDSFRRSIRRALTPR